MELYSQEFLKNFDNYITKIDEENKNITFLSDQDFIKQKKIVESFLKKKRLKFMEVLL